jgi:hypothetical protein
MPYSSSAFWTSGVPLRPLEITLPLPRDGDAPLGLGLHALGEEGSGLVLISSVAPGSLAEKQLRPGDMLRSINGSAVAGDVAIANSLIADAPGVLQLQVC